jgi:hypothetical protein
LNFEPVGRNEEESASICKKENILDNEPFLLLSIKFYSL